MVKYKFPLRTPTKQFDANYLKAHGGELAQIYQEVEKGAMISQDMVAKVTQELELINSDYWSQPHKLSPRWRDLNEAYIRFLLPPEAMHDWNSGQDIWLTRPGEVAKLPK